jgi:hypothetical protein
MKWPIVEILSATAALVGACGLIWYENLPKAKQEEADGLAQEYAKQIYNMALDSLNASQLGHVWNLVRKHLA